MRAIMGAYVERGDMPGLVTVISRGDQTYIDAYGRPSFESAGEMRRDSIFRIASLTKPVTAVAALQLVEDCRLRLDDPLDNWLPELAKRQVLNRIDTSLDDTSPARRPLVLRDLLTLRMGLGHIMAPSADFPIRKALTERGLLLGPPQPQSLPSSDDWLKKVGELPLMYQPGERWLYDLSLDVLGVLIERVSGMSLDDYMRQRIFEPLGMLDTGFFVPKDKLARLVTCYSTDRSSGALRVYDHATNGQWSSAPTMCSGAGGLVTTASDYLAFCRMLLDKGRHGGERLLSPASVELMTSDQVPAAQRRGQEIFFGDSSSWGLGIAVNILRDCIWTVPGRFGWDGGLGTSAYSDPTNDFIGILLTQRLMDSPAGPAAFQDFWTCAYTALE
jgi:CubicO group peptidase (beta-lactamase class C family)